MQERPRTQEPAARRPPTAAEARALGHPVRLRILFACRERARTNKELAAGLGTTPGTIHYHLKQLVAQGFLRAETPRPGPRGSTEQPYLATGKSWQLDMSSGNRTLRQVGAEELLAAAEEDIVMLSRLGMDLTQQEADELVERLEALIEEFAARSRTAPGPRDPERPGGEPLTVLVAVHRSDTAPRTES